MKRIKNKLRSRWEYRYPAGDMLSDNVSVDDVRKGISSAIDSFVAETYNVGWNHTMIINAQLLAVMYDMPQFRALPADTMSGHMFIAGHYHVSDDDLAGIAVFCDPYIPWDSNVIVFPRSAK